MGRLVPAPIIIFIFVALIFEFSSAQFWPDNQNSQTQNQNYQQQQQGPQSWSQGQSSNQYPSQGNQPYGISQPNPIYGAAQSPQQYPSGGSYPSPQQSGSSRTGLPPLRFCTVSNDEQEKCEKMKFDLREQNFRSADPVRGKRQSAKAVFRGFEFWCVQAIDKLECMKLVGKGDADVVLVTPGEAYVGSKDFNLVPLLYEVLGTDRLDAEDQAMAIVRTTSGITDISQLRGRKACFGQVGDTVTWDLVASYLAKQTGQLQTPQCHESYMDSMMKYFGDMCAPYDSRNYTQEENDRYRKLCALCGGSFCPPLSVVNKDYAINCITENPSADVAFVSATTLREVLTRRTLPDPAMYQVLCPKRGGAVPLPSNVNSNPYNPYSPSQSQTSEVRNMDEIWADCHIGKIPSNVWLTRQNHEYREEMAGRMQRIFWMHSSKNNQGLKPQWYTGFFTGHYETPEQQPVDIQALNRDLPQTVEAYLDTYVSYLDDPAVCSMSARAKWCTTSTNDKEKCEMMRKAFKAHRIRPDIECQPPVKNSYICLDKIHRNQSDLALIDIGDLVVAGSYYDTIQIAQERYVNQDRLGYSSTIVDELYSVAVVRDQAIRTLADLRDKKACFSGLYEAHGFMLPISSIKNQSLLSNSECDYLASAIQYFGDSCLPGLADAEINLGGESKEKMCKICENGERGCSRGGESRYAGQLGALNCLMEQKGDVAFVSHTALGEISEQDKGRFHLVCGTNTGGTQPLDNYATCNLGRAPGNVLVTNLYKSIHEKRRLADMILTASRLFSADLTSSGNQGFRLSFSPGAMDRGRKTFNMFGRRNLTDPLPSNNYYQNANPPQLRPNAYTTQSYNGYGRPTVAPQYGQINSQPSTYSYTPKNAGLYSMFGIGAYDLRGFTDMNQTHVGEALGNYRYLAERTNWKRCHETGAASRLVDRGLLSVFLAVSIRMFTL